MTTTEPVIRLREVMFTHPAREGEGSAFTLRVDELAIGPGTLAACIGPSGSGKSTMLDLIAGLHATDQGELHVAGHAIHTLDAHERRTIRLREIGLVFQNLALVEYLSALENILLPTFIDSALRSDLKQRAHELAQSLEIDHLLGRRPKKLSQGERQRVAICRALVTDPKILLCDEPTGNLDPERSQRAVDLLLDAAKANGAAVVMATHDHSLLARFDRVIDMAELHSVSAQEADV